MHMNINEKTIGKILQQGERVTLECKKVRTNVFVLKSYNTNKK